MALTFPASPTTGQVYTTANGITYSYNGTSWVAINSTYAIGGFRKLDSIASQFNGSNTTFNLSVSGVSITPGSAQNLNIVIGGVPQEPGVSYTLSNNSIQFSSAPTSGMSFYGVLLGDVMNVGVPSDSTVTSSKLDANINISGTLTSTNVNVSGSLTSSNTTLSGKFVPPTGNTASRPSNPTLGTLYYNTENDAFENYTAQGWLKVSVKVPSVSSISGNIYSGNTSTLSFSGSGFGAGTGIVNFVSGAVSSSVTTSSLTDTTATVLVPAPIYALGSGNTVNITLTNSDGVGSGITQKTSIGLPTGGTITTANGYYIHKFTSSNTFVVPTGFTATANVLIVAGGGGGGWDVGAGGGAGGLIYQNATSLTVGSYSLVIGSGGAGAVAGSDPARRGSNGSDTTGFVYTAIGGGGGGGWGSTGNVYGSGASGGSGGGTTSNLTTGGSGTSGQGNAGGTAANNTSNVNDYSGASGGGGAGGAGGNGTGSGWSLNSTSYGYGGVGLYYSQFSSVGGSPSGWFAGGGGSSSDNGTFTGAGGNGGGANGNGYAGTTNTGGGGGGGGIGGSGNNIGGSGGSGIVIVRYQLP